MLNLINPKLALTLIRNEVQNHVKHPVDKYQMIYKDAAGEILFRVWCPEKYDLPEGYADDTRARLYTWNDSEMIVKTLKPMLAEKLKPGENVDLGIITWDRFNDLIQVEIAYTDKDGNKLKLSDNI